MTLRRADSPSASSPQPSALRVLIAGVSCRAAAESAARAGFRVTSLDAFADRDHHPSVRALSLTRDFGAGFTVPAVARAARSVDCDAVAYVSSFENHPASVGALAAGRELWGNPPSVLRRARDPLRLARALRTHHIAGPVSVRRPAAGAGRRRWLAKPLASGGGRGVRLWHRGDRIPRGCYFQEFLDGTPGSVVFVAAAGRAVPIGLSRQLVGEPAFGATGFTYCGNILGAAGDAQFARDASLVRAACSLARAIATEFGLVGVNGIDFIARDGVPHAIEINPRWSASMELVERAYGLSVFAAHAAACAGFDCGFDLDFDLVRARRGAGAVGKAIVFARRDITVGDTRAWMSAGVRDVPHPGERILTGRPVCTVFGAARDSSACHDALVRRANWVYGKLAAWERNAA